MSADDDTPFEAMTVGECQPYARHYLHSLGLSDSDLAASAWRGVDFIAWSMRRWQAFADSLGLAREKVSATTHGQQYGAWLADRCGCAS